MVWLVRSKKFATFAYYLTEQIKSNLSNFVRNFCEIPIGDACTYGCEIEENIEFRNFMTARLMAHNEENEIDGLAF